MATRVTRDLTGDYAVERVRQKIEEFEATLGTAAEADIGTAPGEVAAADHVHVAADVDGVQVLHGWPLDENSDRLVTLAYDAGTRKVTITALAGGTFDVYVLGEKVTVASPHVSAAHTATAGGWFYYHDGTNWVWSQDPWDMREVATTCYVYWSTVAASGVAYYELHGANRNPEWHWHAHFAQGTVLISGGVLGDYTLATDTDAAIQFSITETVIADEDIHRTLTAKADGAGFTIWRRSGTSGVWTWSTSETLPFLYSTYPQRNYDAGGGTGWTMADVSGLGLGTYVTAYVLAVPSLDTAQRYIVVPGQTQYSSLATAQAETIASLTLGDLPWPEACPIAQLVFQAKSTFGGTAKAEIVAVTRLIGNRATITGAASASSHNSLSGLQGGTAGEYYHLTAAQYEELTMAYALRYDQDADPPTVAYLGQAVPGTATSAASWRIQKLTFGADGDVTSQWADGNSSMDNVWDNRAALTYS